MDVQGCAVCTILSTFSYYFRKENTPISSEGDVLRILSTFMIVFLSKLQGVAFMLSLYLLYVKQFYESLSNTTCFKNLRLNSIVATMNLNKKRLKTRLL